ncbi:uncharacterized protein LOC105182717 [Harpegnathos saltator]|uniref:uncharacterized protein LOC105182717 n=1 Tax=Harpegnathos saltator TaxID=610380 RepID=UPI000DBEE6D6|nr:uncharacterized protein LOC105182717 [Harpegnathos saltator]
MYVFDDRNHKFNQTLLKLLGLWPYGRTKFQRLRAICFFVLLLSYVVVQLAQFAVADIDSDAVIRILSDALPSTGYFIKFTLFFYNDETTKQMLKQITNNWRMLTDMREIKIAEYYARRGRHVTIFLTSSVMLGVFGFIVMEMMPDILDFALPLNESRVRYLPPMNEYRGYQGAYFYPIFLYVNISIIIGGLTVASVGSMLIVIVLHCCAILKISSYRMEHSVSEEIIARPDREHLIIERIIKSVKLHQNAQNLIEMLMSRLSVFFLTLLTLGIISLSINLFRVSTNLFSRNF